MATYDELVAAARRADAAGDGPAAKRFLELAAQARGQVAKNLDGTYGQPPEGFVLNPKTGQMEDLRSPNNPNIPTGRAVSLGLGAGQGLGFGGLDEAVAGGSALVGGNYDYDLARMREAERRAQEEHPGFYYGGLVPGAVASSVSAGKALGVNPTGKNMVDTMLRGAGIGGAEGTLWGALTGEGGAENRALNAGKNALVGAGVGLAAPPVIGAATWGARKAGDLIGGGFDALVNRANSGRANRSVIEMLKKAGLSVDDVADDVTRAAQEGQPEYRLMDAAGVPGQRRASGVVRAGGDGATEIADFLRQRQIDQADRVTGFIDDAFGTGGTTAAKTREGLTAARGAAADVAYDAARGNAAPVDIRGALAVIDDRIGGMSGSGVSGDGIDGTMAGFRARLAAQPGGPKFPGSASVELSDFNRVLGVKQDVQDAIGAAVRAGRNNEARELGKLVKALDAALEASSDMYRTANDEFAKASRVIGAVDDGAAMAARGRHADTIPAFQAMTPEQQAAARVGYGDNVLSAIERNKAVTANKAREFSSTKRAAEANAMALDPQLFGSRIGRENVMWETQNRALGGSRTADNLADVADVGMVADMGRAAKDALTGRIGAALGTVAAKAGPVISGQNEATRSLIAKMLMSGDPKAALAQALRQETTSQGRRRIVEAMTRALGREFNPIQ